MTDSAAPGGARASCPYIVAVDDDADARDRVVQALTRRYGADYRVAGYATASSALEALVRIREDGEAVAVVLADQWMRETTGTELLAQAAEHHPRARRGLLIDWGAWGHGATAKAIHAGMARGAFDYYLPKPWHSPDEFFHRTVAEFLHEWSWLDDSTAHELVVVGSRRSIRARELTDLLARNGIPHGFSPSDSPEGRRLLEEAGHARAGRPIVKLLDGRVLVDPSNAELAGAYGVTTSLEGSRDFDLIVVGAGPAGLATAVYASSEGLRTLVVEAEAVGGQAGSSALIRNYLGFSRGVSGAELAQRAYQQAWVFGTRFLHMRRATALHCGSERHTLRMSDGTAPTAKVVVLASGVAYRRLNLPALEDLTGVGVFYGASVAEAASLDGENVFVVGGGNSAGQAAMHLCRYARRVTLLVRGRSLAQSMSQYLCDQLAAQSKIGVRLNTQVVDAGGDGRLEWLRLRDRRSGETETVAAAALFVLIGARPRTEWLPPEVERDPWGYVATGADVDPAAPWPLERPPLGFETSVPGVFVVGDARRRSVKRVASAVGEGSVVVQQVHQYLSPGGTEVRARVEPRAGARI
ncbi:MAG TPA: FAD-dependent oxidoreductase [Thermoleophilaceae bacterium]|nr:FAD-dependent oxidoreductase [Thermoleophilaceae bacterium]